MDLNLLKLAGTLISSLVVWYIWSIKQKFALKKDVDAIKKEVSSKVSKEELKEFKTEYYKESKYLSERLIKIEILMENTSNTILEIKEYLFKRKRKD